MGKDEPTQTPPASKPPPASELEPLKPAGQITEEFTRKNIKEQQ